MLCLELIFIICILQFDSWYRNCFVCDILYVLRFSAAREIFIVVCIIVIQLSRVFPRPFTNGGGGIWTSAEGQSVNGGTHEGGTKTLWGDLTLIDYIIN